MRVLVTNDIVVSCPFIGVAASTEEETYARGSHPTLDTETGNPDEGDKSAASDVKTFSGTAVLNEGMKITSLVLRK